MTELLESTTLTQKRYTIQQVIQAIDGGLKLALVFDLSNTLQEYKLAFGDEYSDDLFHCWCVYTLERQYYLSLEFEPRYSHNWYKAKSLTVSSLVDLLLAEVDYFWLVAAVGKCEAVRVEFKGSRICFKV